VADNNGVKYLADGTVPSDWTSASFNPSWTTLPSNPRPSVTSQTLQFFTTSFTVSNKNSYQGYELSLKARAGVLVYLNGKELYLRVTSPLLLPLLEVLRLLLGVVLLV